jgi:hypothetical protein
VSRVVPSFLLGCAMSVGCSSATLTEEPWKLGVSHPPPRVFYGAEVAVAEQRPASRALLSSAQRGFFSGKELRSE